MTWGMGSEYGSGIYIPSASPSPHLRCISPPDPSSFPVYRAAGDSLKINKYVTHTRNKTSLSIIQILEHKDTKPSEWVAGAIFEGRSSLYLVLQIVL